MNELSHYDADGRIRMVDVSGKPAGLRRAVASARVILSPSTLEILTGGNNPKGDPLEIARIAGIQAAKRTSELIPLCHQIALANVEVTANYRPFGIYLEAQAVTTAGTGVEMEALTAVTVAALTVYDMCKAVQHDIAISDIVLESKTGGKSDYVRS
jgi:cyclic pyranopterin monophosphate synthase